MSTVQPMAARKAFWNALLMVLVPVTAAVVLVVHFFSPEAHEMLGLTIVLTVMFGIPGVLLFALLYRRYRHPVSAEQMSPSARFGLGFLHVFFALIGLGALAVEPPKHTWRILVDVLFFGSIAYRGVFLILGKHPTTPATPAGEGTNSVSVGGQ